MQTENCKICGAKYEITDLDISLYKKFNEKPQNICFECSQKRRICFRNERSLYKRKCDFEGSEIISIYSPDKPYKIYKAEYWYSDKWDPLSYGRDFNFSRPFFEQFKELQLLVPRIALSNAKCVNSDYCNMSFYNKNCYLIFGGDFNEDSMYGTLCMHNRNVAECDYSNNCEVCYEISDCLGCYNVNFATDCKECSDCNYISDCIGCRECILCTNLINQSFCIENEKLPKEEYFEKKKSLLSDRNETYKKFLELRKKRIVKFAHQIMCENSTGDYLKNCKNCINCFDVSDSEDMKDVIFGTKDKDCFQSSLIGDGSQLIYNSLSILKGFNVKHSFWAIESSEIEYSDFSSNSQNLFGCVGLHHKKYCIFNKQYSKDDYEKLRARIIAHMKETEEYGQFFPPELSCFGYNESTANTYFPMTRERALNQGYKWKK